MNPVRVHRSVILGLCLVLAPLCAMAQSQDRPLIDTVGLSDTVLCHYLHIGRFGGLDARTDLTALERSMGAGDEIRVRWYPNMILTLNDVGTKLLKNGDSTGTVGAFFVYPYDHTVGGNPPLSMQAGNGTVLYAAPTGNNLFLRYGAESLNVAINSSISRKQLSDYRAGRREEAKYLSAELGTYGWSAKDDWRIWQVRDVCFETGKSVLELYSEIGDSAILLARVRIAVLPRHYTNVLLIHRVDVTVPDTIPMVSTGDNTYFEGRITPDKITLGVHELNVRYCLDTVSNEYQTAPSAGKYRDVRHSGYVFAIRRLQSLPGNIRFRGGFAVFDKASECRLISNLVFVLNPQKYFAHRTPLVNMFNPTVGVQIGGTGNKDIVFLMGCSVKLIPQADLVVGFRFGREDSTSAWVLRRNLYFGATLDPLLFGRLREARYR